VAFQIADDVLDIRSDGDVSGKTPGTDLREGVATMPVLLLRQRVALGHADADDKALVDAIDGDLSDDAALLDVVTRLRGHAVIGETVELAQDWADRAVEAISALPEGEVKQAFVAFAASLVARAT
jgi:heptaprenyl diphosphate synthase